MGIAMLGKIPLPRSQQIAPPKLTWVKTYLVYHKIYVFSMYFCCLIDKKFQVIFGE